MKNYQVTIILSRQPEFATDVPAANEQDAIVEALKLARACGFNGKVNKTKVRELELAT